jgi:hypothetical protein
MQLKLTRSQRDGGIVSKTVLFCLDARVQLTSEEQASVSRYKLGGQLIYNSEASQRRVKAGEAAMADGKGSGNLKALAQFALARLHLNITVDSLQRGQHIECKSLEELLQAEEALMEACKNLRAYLDTAASFDGREVLIDFSGAEPVVVSSAEPPMLAAPFVAPAGNSPFAGPELGEHHMAAQFSATGSSNCSGSWAANHRDGPLGWIEALWQRSPAMTAFGGVVGVIVLLVLLKGCS